MTTTTTRPETAYSRAIESTRRQFEANTRDHQMTVLHDTTFVGGAPYRHVRFAEPGTSIWSFDLVTWPGHLSISRDLQPFMFRRTHDMFAFFNSRDINPGYWAEKLVAGQAEGYCDETFKESVRSHLDDYLTDIHDQPKFDAVDAAAIRTAVQEELLDADPNSVDYAHHLLREFSVYLPSSGEQFRFSDTYEFSVEGYLHHFLLSCHAIRWGVETYLREFPDRLLDAKD